MSWSTNFVSNDTNGVEDVFLHDRYTGETTCISVTPAGIPGDSFSDIPSISESGRFIAFQSSSSNLVPGDTNIRQDIFVFDQRTQALERVSVSSSGGESDGSSRYPSISGDGSKVAFYSVATNLAPGPPGGAYVHDRNTGQTICVNVDSHGNPGLGFPAGIVISGDGRFAAFSSDSDILVPGDGNQSVDIFVHDLLTGTTTRVSIDSSGNEGNDSSWSPSLSDDGRFVAFLSEADNLVVGDSNGFPDIFIHDRLNGQTKRVSLNSQGQEALGESYYPRISGNGERVVFVSEARNLDLIDTNWVSDVFVHDLALGETRMVNLNTAGNPGWGGATWPSLSSEGNLVVFDSGDSILVPNDTNGKTDVFVRDSLGPSLTQTGQCPGTITFHVSSASVGHQVALFYGRPGFSVNPHAPCQGIELDIAAPRLGGITVVNVDGIASFTVTLPSGACGLRVQAVDALGCRPSKWLKL